jgi:hypothetical protein
MRQGMSLVKGGYSWCCAVARLLDKCYTSKIAGAGRLGFYQVCSAAVVLSPGMRQGMSLVKGGHSWCCANCVMLCVV